MAMFSYEFMIRAFLAAGCMAIIAPLLGIFLVIRRQSLMADTLSHVSLAGIALGLYWNLNPTVTTLCVVIIAAVLLEILRSMYSTYSEVSTAILMSGGLALSLVLMSMSGGNSSMRINQYLFGSIVTISWSQVKMLAILMLVLLILFMILKRPMYVLTFDEDTAHVDGLPIRLMSILFNVITGVAITMMIPIAGALLVAAIMILPAAIAMKLGKNFNLVIIISMIIGLIGMLSGLVSSYQLDLPAGALITLIFIALFVIVNLLLKLFTLAKKHSPRT